MPPQGSAPAPEPDISTLFSELMNRGLLMAKAPVPLQEILDEYIESRTLDHAKSYVKRLREAKRHVLAFFDPKTNVHTMTASDIDRYIAARMRKSAKATINREIALMKAAFYLGLQRQKLNYNVLMRRRRLSERMPSEVVRLPVQDDAQALRMITDILAHGPEWIEPVILTLIATSERVGAVLALRVADIEGETIHFRPGTLKTKPEGRVVFCLENLAKILRATTAGFPPYAFLFWARDGSPGVRQLSYSSLRQAWITASTRAGIVPHPRIHDLRHFCNSTLDRHGIRETIIQAQLGHVTSTMTAHYTHRRIQDTLPAAKILDEIVGKVAAEKTR